MLWIELTKAIVAGWVASDIARRVDSPWAKAIAFIVAVLVGQLGAVVTGAILLNFYPAVFTGPFVATSAITPWTSLVFASIGLYVGSRARSAAQPIDGNISDDARAMLAKLNERPLVKSADLLAAAELVRLGRAECYEGKGGELYLRPYVHT